MATKTTILVARQATGNIGVPPIPSDTTTVTSSAMGMTPTVSPEYDDGMSKQESQKANQPSDDDAQTTNGVPPDQNLDVVEKADTQQLQHFVSTIKTAEQQVGENIISALQHDGTVAVLTTVVMGPDGQQRVVTAALKPAMMAQVQNILAEAAVEREEEEPCVGFHCLVKPKTNLPES